MATIVQQVPDVFTEENKLRQAICSIGKLLHERGYVAACDGNISVRFRSNLVLCTPTSISKGMMQPEDLVIVDMQGRQISGNRRVSTEVGMHLLFYGLRTDVMAVVHAHPATATGFAAAGLSLEEPLVAEVVLACGKIPLACYGTPGTPELVAAMRPLVHMHAAILMANHGVVTCGRDLLDAYMKMETVEHCARINLVARQLGPVRPLPADEVKKLLRVRENCEAGKRAP